MTSAFSIRRARHADATDIAAIYNHYILDSCATFDTEPKSDLDRVEWLAERGADQPVFVLEGDDRVVAWGALTRYGSRPAWRRTVEIGIYVDPSHVGEGHGRALGEVLLREAIASGHHVVIAQVVSDNEASLALMRRLGFGEVGRLREVGYKFGKYHDVVLLERVL